MPKAPEYDYTQLAASERLSIIEQRLEVLENGRPEIRGLEVQLQQAEVDARMEVPGAEQRVVNIKEQITAHRALADERKAKVAELRDAVANAAQKETG